ncbi:hypothetical protein ACNTOD_003890 [Vibrio navarrensis]
MHFGSNFKLHHEIGGLVILKVLLPFFSALVLCSCSAYKISAEENFKAPVNELTKIEVVQLNKYPEGFQCFEPLLYVLTFGIVPAECVDTYSVSMGTQELGHITVSSMNGWVALLLAPFSSWEYGQVSEVEQKIQDFIEVAE